MHLKVFSPFAFLFCLLICNPANAQLKFPATPAPGQLVQDYADIISAKDKEAIRVLQYRSYEDDDTPICVVTIPSKQTFNGINMGIEKIAHDLFDKWQIGKRVDGKLINQGILVLVSVGDRKARIELGNDWEKDWDDQCDKIMNRSMVPQFKKGNYSAGILEGVQKLAQMGKLDPSKPAPFSLADSMNEPMLEGFNPIPIWAGILMLIGGMGLIIAGVLLPDYRKPLIIVGFILMLVALVYYAALFVLALLAKGDGIIGDSDGSGWSGGGGFDSGGFSGGGGSTGSW